MSHHTSPNPFELLLRVVERLEAQDLKVLQSMVPFLERGAWISRRLLPDGSGASGPASRLSSDPVDPPDRVLAFILANWDQMECRYLEQIMNGLEDGFPGARIEALPLATGEG